VRNDYPYVVEFIRLPGTRQPGANGFAFAPVPQHVGLLRPAGDGRNLFTTLIALYCFQKRPPAKTMMTLTESTNPAGIASSTPGFWFLLTSF